MCFKRYDIGNIQLIISIFKELIKPFLSPFFLQNNIRSFKNTLGRDENILFLEPLLEKSI